MPRQVESPAARPWVTPDYSVPREEALGSGLSREERVLPLQEPALEELEAQIGEPEQYRRIHRKDHDPSDGQRLIPDRRLDEPQNRIVKDVESVGNLPHEDESPAGQQARERSAS